MATMLEFLSMSSLDLPLSLLESHTVCSVLIHLSQLLNLICVHVGSVKVVDYKVQD